MTDKLKPVVLNIRLYPGTDDDLIAWLNTLDDLHFGGKTHAVREALRRGVNQSKDDAAQIDLGEVRRVVEAAVESALARFEGNLIGAEAVSNPERDAESLLDDLGSALMLEDQGEDI